MFVVTDIYHEKYKVHMDLARQVDKDLLYTVEDYDNGVVYEYIDYETLSRLRYFGKFVFQASSIRTEIIYKTSRVQWDFLGITDGLIRVDSIQPNSITLKIGNTVNLLHNNGTFVQIISFYDPMHILDFYQIIAKSGVCNGVAHIYILHGTSVYELSWNRTIKLFVSKSIVLGNSEHYNIVLSQVDNKVYQVCVMSSGMCLS